MITITLSLSDYLNLACRGIDQVATVTNEFGQYIKSTDATEQLCHVEFIDNNLAQIYPILEWRASVRRREALQKASEESRQRIFQQEALQQEHKQKIQRRRDILDETRADVMKRFKNILQVLCSNQSHMTYNRQVEFLDYILFRALNGENQTIATKLGISVELINEFKSLPGDPNWKNTFYLGGMKI